MPKSKQDKHLKEVEKRMKAVLAQADEVYATTLKPEQEAVGLALVMQMSRAILSTPSQPWGVQAQAGAAADADDDASSYVSFTDSDDGGEKSHTRPE